MFTFVLGLAIGGFVASYGIRHYSLSAVKAEIAKIESEFERVSHIAKVDFDEVVARVKALL
jgi:hypothetical protein